MSQVTSKYELHITKDGSNTLYMPEIDEFFHSPRGAISESIHVFIEAGLKHLLKSSSKTISILEIGFGTGLNALLTLSESINSGINIYYESIDKFPLSLDQLNKVDHKSKIACSFDDYLSNMLESDWNKETRITDQFTINKRQIDLLEYDSSKNFDLVYYDAFAPSKQAEMWTLEALEKVKNVMNEKSVLVTYCAQGQFKRNLKSLNFKVESLPGANHKREMVRASLGL